MDFQSLPAKAIDLHKNRACPHCGGKIRLWEALAMVFGSTIRYYVKARVESGEELIIPVDHVNPQTMTVADPEAA